MHKGVIILTEAQDKWEAESNVESFLEPYGDGRVWDYYVIGGGWHNALAPAKLVKEFDKWVKEEYKDVFNENGMYNVSDLENDKVREHIQNKWESLGLRGKNIYYSAYGFDVTDTDADYNIVPLKDCLDIVKDWSKDLKVEKTKLWNELLEAKEKADNGKWDMTAYLAGQYKDVCYGNFCFDSNVFNATTYDAEQIPSNINDYYAVMVDMHN